MKSICIAVALSFVAASTQAANPMLHKYMTKKDAKRLAAEQLQRRGPALDTRLAPPKRLQRIEALPEFVGPPRPEDAGDALLLTKDDTLTPKNWGAGAEHEGWIQPPAGGVNPQVAFRWETEFFANDFPVQVTGADLWLDNVGGFFLFNDVMFCGEDPADPLKPDCINALHASGGAMDGTTQNPPGVAGVPDEWNRFQVDLTMAPLTPFDIVRDLNVDDGVWSDDFDAFPTGQVAELIGVGDDITLTFPGILSYSPMITMNSVTVTGFSATATLTATDDGAGGLTGDMTGTIDYNSGTITVNFSTPPVLDSPVFATYDTSYNPSIGNSNSDWLECDAAFCFDKNLEVLPAGQLRKKSSGQTFGIRVTPDATVTAQRPFLSTNIAVSADYDISDVNAMEAGVMARVMFLDGFYYAVADKMANTFVLKRKDPMGVTTPLGSGGVLTPTGNIELRVTDEIGRAHV